MSEPTFAPTLDAATLEAEPLADEAPPAEPVAAPQPRITFKWGSIPFVLSHVAALGIFFVPFRWSLLALCLGLYVIKMFGITGGYHRYFSHRTFKTSRAFQ